MDATSEIPMVAVMLEARELLGDVPDTIARDPSRFSFGHDEPSAVTPATPDLDEELRATLSADQEHRFVALRFTCSFRPDDDPLTESRLAIPRCTRGYGPNGGHHPGQQDGTEPKRSSWVRPTSARSNRSRGRW
jgi:hypothetical protein